MCETWSETGAAPSSLSHCGCPRSLQPPTISSAAPKRQTATLLCSFRILPYMSTSQNNTSMSPEEYVPDAHSNPVSSGGEQTDLSSPEQAPRSLAIENPSGPSSPAAVASAAQTAPTRPTSASSDPTVLHSKPVQRYLRSMQQRIYPCRRATTRGLSDITGSHPYVWRPREWQGWQSPRRYTATICARHVVRRNLGYKQWPKLPTLRGLWHFPA